jgi:hypothetical protein
MTPVIQDLTEEHRVLFKAKETDTCESIRKQHPSIISLLVNQQPAWGVGHHFVATKVASFPNESDAVKFEIAHERDGSRLLPPLKFGFGPQVTQPGEINFLTEQVERFRATVAETYKGTNSKVSLFTNPLMFIFSKKKLCVYSHYIITGAQVIIDENSKTKKKEFSVAQVPSNLLREVPWFRDLLESRREEDESIRKDISVCVAWTPGSQFGKLKSLEDYLNHIDRTRHTVPHKVINCRRSVCGGRRLLPGQVVLHSTVSNVQGPDVSKVFQIFEKV